MSLFRQHQDEPRESRCVDPRDSAGRRFEVTAEDGSVTCYAADDFEEIFTTPDEREARRHISLGWLLLDEVVGPGKRPGQVGPDDVTTYVLGYLKPGRTGQST